MAIEKHPFLGRLLTTIIGGLAVVAIVGGVYYRWPDTARIFITTLADFFSHPIPLWFVVTIVLVVLTLLFLLSRLFNHDRLPKQHLTEVYGPLWYWSVFAGRLDVSSLPLCPRCKNELTATDEPIWPASAPTHSSPSPMTLLTKYPDRYAAHVVCSRSVCRYQKIFNNPQSDEDFQSVPDLHAAVQKEIRRRINNRELIP